MLFVHRKLCPQCQTYKQTAPLCSPKDLSQHFKQCCSQRLPQALHAVDCHSPLEWLVDPLCRGGKSPRNVCRRWECGRRETNISKQFHSLPRRYETAGAMKQQELCQFPLHRHLQIKLVSPLVTSQTKTRK